MTRRPVTAREVKEANLAVYNRTRAGDYDRNASIFHPRRQAAIETILRGLKERTGGSRLLDLGCGTGNLLRAAKGIFPERVGLDLASRLVAQVRSMHPDLRLAAGDSERLPFPDSSMDVISLYAVLHHILDPMRTFREAFRCLRAGGFLYTDHDPNWFLQRFYHPWYRLRHRGRPGFGSEDEEIAEYHTPQGGGLNPERLAARLRDAGFAPVEVRYRQTDNESLRFAALLALGVLRGAANILGWKSLYTHFWITARKP